MSEPGVDVTGTPIVGADGVLEDDPVEEAMLDLVLDGRVAAPEPDRDADLP